jgi:hypothetical protein
MTTDSLYQSLITAIAATTANFNSNKEIQAGIFLDEFEQRARTDSSSKSQSEERALLDKYGPCCASSKATAKNNHALPPHVTMHPLVNLTPLLWTLLISALVLLSGAAIFFFDILKGKEIEARLEQRSQKLSRSILGGGLIRTGRAVSPGFPQRPEGLRSTLLANQSIFSSSKVWTTSTSTKSYSSRSSRANPSSQTTNPPYATLSSKSGVR